MVSSAETKLGSTTTFSEEPKFSRGINTMPRVVKRKLQKIKPVIEYNKRGKPYGPARIEMQSYIGQGGKKMMLSSAGKKWKDFKSTLTRQHILPFINEKEKLRQPPELYKFIEKADWDAFDDLEESMPGVEIDRSTLWKKAREDKHSNISDPKFAEKAKLIDELQKQVSEGTLTVSRSNDVLTMALGPEHPRRVRGVGAGIFTRQYFNLPRQ
ncbi:unnamed protein product [Prunus brigantina]